MPLPTDILTWPPKLGASDAVAILGAVVVISILGLILTIFVASAMESLHDSLSGLFVLFGFVMTTYFCYDYIWRRAINSSSK